MKAISGVYLPTQHRIPGFKKSVFFPSKETKSLFLIQWHMLDKSIKEGASFHSKSQWNFPLCDHTSELRFYPNQWRFFVKQLLLADEKSFHK